MIARVSVPLAMRFVRVVIQFMFHVRRMRSLFSREKIILIVSEWFLLRKRCRDDITYDLPYLNVTCMQCFSVPQTVPALFQAE